jgi:hypothetical protein
MVPRNLIGFGFRRVAKGWNQVLYWPSIDYRLKACESVQLSTALEPDAHASYRPLIR